MHNNIKYNLFLFISSLSRNLIEVFNVLLLYKFGYNIKEIFLYYSIFFLISVFVNIITVYLTNYIKIKYILILSNILFCLSYYFLNNTGHTITNLLLFSLLSSFANYTYHLIRHYYALKYTDVVDNEIGNIVIFSFLASVLSSYLGPFITEKYSFTMVIIIILILSLISIIPLILIKEDKKVERIINIKIDKSRILFFILEQSKVIFLLIQPLYLYLYISNSLRFVGIFNAINCFASIILIYLLVRRDNLSKYFKYFNLILVLILLLKLNILSKNIILILAFFEGLFIKIYDIVSIKNLYQVNIKNIKSYLLKAEIYFCLTRSIIMFIFYLFISNIKVSLYLLLIVLLISGFIKTDKIN